jgi:hypothetical protein
VAAGIVAAASVVTDLPPLLKWTVTIIGGGGIAGLVQASSVLLRFKSTALTGGLANPLLATLELVGAVVTALLAILVPLAGLALVAVLAAVAVRRRRPRPA